MALYLTEIQELRHKTSTGEEENTTGIIDDSLMKLDEKLENISKGVKSVGESLETLTASSSDANMAANMLAKQEDLLSEWESVQEDSNVLREELKEDKWLTVFRTVTDQADGMMSSLEKAVNRCQVNQLPAALCIHSLTDGFAGIHRPNSEERGSTSVLIFPAVPG